MDDLKFLTQQAIQSANSRGAELISLTFSGGQPWMERAALGYLHQAGFLAVKVQIQDPVGPLRLVEIEVARRQANNPASSD